MTTMEHADMAVSAETASFKLENRQWQTCKVKVLKLVQSFQLGLFLVGVCQQIAAL